MKIEEEVIQMIKFVAHVECMDNSILQMKSTAQYELKKIYKRLSSDVKKYRAILEKHMTEGEIGQIDALVDYYEQILQLTDKEVTNHFEVELFNPAPQNGEDETS